jgi:hypothetical protein
MQPDNIEERPVSKPKIDPDIITDKQFIKIRYDFRKLYINGYFPGATFNLFGLWNNLMLWFYKNFTKKTYGGYKKGISEGSLYL